MIRPFDKHLDSDELDGLVASQGIRVPDLVGLSEQAVREAQRHVESCQDCSQKLQMHRWVQSEILRAQAPNSSPRTSECIGDAEWLDVAAGLLPDAKTRELMNHAAQCDHCGPLLKDAAEALVDETTPSEERLLTSLSSARPEWRKNMAATLRASAGAKGKSREKKEAVQWWQALFSWPRPAFALAGIAVAVLAGWLGLRMLHPPSAEQLLAQAYTERRTLEVRIAGAKYAPMRIERSAGGSNLDKPPSLLKAEALIGDNLRKSPNDPIWLRARAQADLLDGNFESAIKSLQRALETQPDSPQLLTDLGSAYFLRAEVTNRAIDYGDAIESLSKALAKSPDDPVALFNRALACERMFLYTQAVDDWEHYLRVDAAGDWSQDARRRLAALKEKLQQHGRSLNEPLLTPAEIAKAGADDGALRAKIDERVEEYLNAAVTDWLPNAYLANPSPISNPADLQAALQVLAEITVQKHGDRWLRDLLLSASSPNFPAAALSLSRALKADDSGDNVAAREHASAAERLFVSASDESGMLRAQVEYLFASHDAQDGGECIRTANRIRQRLESESYSWLSAQFFLEQGTCFWFVGNIGEARRSYDRAESIAQVSGYRVIFLRSQDHLSTLSTETGDFAGGAARTRSALAQFWSGQYPVMRGYNLYYQIRESSRLTNHPHLQMAAWRDGLALSDSFSDTVLRAMAHSAMGDAALSVGALQVAGSEYSQAERLFAVAPRIKSTQIDRVEANVRLAEVETSRGSAQEALSRLRQSEQEVSSLSDAFLSILFFSTLGEAASRSGDVNEAESSLRSAIALSEAQLQSIHEDKTRVEWEERTSGAYRNLAQLRFGEGNVQSALEIWELYRGAVTRAGALETSGSASKTSQYEPHEVAAQIPSLTQQTVASYALLPRGLAIWVYDNRGVFGHWVDEDPRQIEDMAGHFRGLCADPNSDRSVLRESARALYDLLVAPIANRLSPERPLLVELDDGLAGLPIDALIDPQGRYLSEWADITLFPGIYYPRSDNEQVPITQDSAAVVVAVPTSSAIPNLSVAPLPDATAEGYLVAGQFRSTESFFGQDAVAVTVLSHLQGATVFHFAGHAFNSWQGSGLLLSDSLVTAASLQKVSLARMRLAVLSGCDTQVGSNGGAYDADSLVRVLLQAGVRDVVASRWNVDSAVTRQFMELFYHALLGGATVADSLREAEASIRRMPNTEHPYYWAAFAGFGRG